MRPKAQRHQSAKCILAKFWRRHEFIVQLELGCDVFAFRVRAKGFEQVFTEFEQSTRNVLRNAQRNLEQSCAGDKKFLIVVPDERLRQAVRLKLRRYLPEATARRFAVALLDAIERRLEASR